MPDEKELTPRESEVMRIFTVCVNATSFHVRHLTQRTEKPVERDLRSLEKKGFLTSLNNPKGDFYPRVLYPTQRGWDWGLGQKLFDKRVHAISDKGSGNLPHDLVLADLYVKFHDTYGEELYWTQLLQHCYRRFGEDPNDRVNMDAFASFPIGNEFGCLLFEVEKSRDKVRKNDGSARLAKVRAYDAYFRGHFQEEFGNDVHYRVIWTFSTDQKALFFAAQLRDMGASAAHWVLCEELIPLIGKDVPLFYAGADIVNEPARRRFYAQQQHSLNGA